MGVGIWRRVVHSGRAGWGQVGGGSGRIHLPRANNIIILSLDSFFIEEGKRCEGCGSRSKAGWRNMVPGGEVVACGVGDRVDGGAVLSATAFRLSRRRHDRQGGSPGGEMDLMFQTMERRLLRGSSTRRWWRPGSSACAWSSRRGSWTGRGLALDQGRPRCWR